MSNVAFNRASPDGVTTVAGQRADDLSSLPIMNDEAVSVLKEIASQHREDMAQMRADHKEQMAALRIGVNKDVAQLANTMWRGLTAMGSIISLVVVIATGGVAWVFSGYGEFKSFQGAATTSVDTIVYRLNALRKDVESHHLDIELLKTEVNKNR